MRLILLSLYCFVSINIFANPRPTLKEVELERLLVEAKQHFILEEFEKAIKDYQALLKKDPKNDVALFEIARCQNYLKNFSSSEKFAVKAIGIEPREAYYKFLGQLYIDNSDFPKASQALEKMLSLYPRNEDIYYNLAYTYLKADKPEKAITAYDSYIKQYGWDPYIGERKFSIYRLMNNESKAIDELEKLIEYAPDNTETLHALAEYYVEIGQQSKADEVYERILKIDPSDQLAKFAEAEKAFNDGDKIGYLNSLGSLFKNPDIEIDLKIKEALNFMSDLATTNDRDFQQSMIDMGKSITEAHPNDAKAYSLYGDILYYTNQYPEATKSYKRTLELDKSILPVWENLMLIQSDLGEFEDLYDTSKKALDVFPNQAGIYYLNGVSLGQIGEGKKAVTSYEEALMRADENPTLKLNILSSLGNQYHEIKEYKKSDESFDEALKMNPDNPLILNNYSYYLSLRDKDLDKAAQMALHANELSPNSPMYQDTYGWVLYKQEKYTEAVTWLEKAVQNGGIEFGEVLEHLGDAYYKSGNEVEALKYWKLAAQKEDASDRIQEKIIKRTLID